MKDVAILALLVAVAWLAFGRFEHPQAVIEDTMLHRAAYPMPDNAVPRLQVCQPVEQRTQQPFAAISEPEAVT